MGPSADLADVQTTEYRGDIHGISAINLPP